MSKFIAILNVVAWAGFWSFGYLALTAGGNQPGQALPALVLAVLGGALGIFAYLWLARHSERIGYAGAPTCWTPRSERPPRHGIPPRSRPEAVLFREAGEFRAS